MTVTTFIHSPRPQQPTRPVTANGWSLTGPLEGWRDDDPDCLPRCAINPEHLIKNGDRYAINAANQVACLACARLPAPPEPVEALQRVGSGAADRRFGGLAERKTPLWKPKARPVTEPTEERVCARTACQQSFTVPTMSKRRHCSSRCQGQDAWDQRNAEHTTTKRQATREERTRTCPTCRQPFVVDRIASTQTYCNQSCAAPRKRRTAAPASPSPEPPPATSKRLTCPTCGARFQPTPKRPAHCCWECEMRSAAGHALRSCGCLTCSDRRIELGRAPLIGRWPEASA